MFSPVFVHDLKKGDVILNNDGNPVTIVGFDIGTEELVRITTCAADGTRKSVIRWHDDSEMKGAF